ncbi:MAG: hypothetical protein ACLP1X_20030 [Polyangiaceae bacterium]|jgi:hypothetical protein
MHGKLVHVGGRAWVKSASIVAVVAIGLALGCSSSSGGVASCTSKGLCPNDTSLTQR